MKADASCILRAAAMAMKTMNTTVPSFERTAETRSERRPASRRLSRWRSIADQRQFGLRLLLLKDPVLLMRIVFTPA
jgi:hypothetical protein